MLKKILRILIVLCGTVGILFDFIAVEFINTPYTNWDGLSLFKYFTIQSNIIVVVYFFTLIQSKFFNPSPGYIRYIGSVVLSISLTFIIFAIFLQPTWNPTGLQFYSSLLLHYITPILAIFYFVRYFKEFTFKQTDYRIWIIYPLAYMVFVLLLGLFTGDYLYPFLDINTNGVLSVVIFIGVASLIYFGLSKLIIHLNHRINNRRYRED